MESWLGQDVTTVARAVAVTAMAHDGSQFPHRTHCVNVSLDASHRNSFQTSPLATTLAEGSKVSKWPASALWSRDRVLKAKDETVAGIPNVFRGRTIASQPKCATYRAQVKTHRCSTICGERSRGYRQRARGSPMLGGRIS